MGFGSRRVTLGRVVYSGCSAAGTRVSLVIPSLGPSVNGVLRVAPEYIVARGASRRSGTCVRKIVCMAIMCVSRRNDIGSVFARLSFDRVVSTGNTRDRGRV